MMNAPAAVKTSLDGLTSGQRIGQWSPCITGPSTFWRSSSFESAPIEANAKS